MVTARPPGPAAKLPAAQCAIAAANIRVLRQRNGWTQAHLGRLMGWAAPSTVCAAEGRRGGRQRRFARWEIDQLAALFGVPPRPAPHPLRHLRRPAPARLRLPGLRSRAPGRPRTPGGGTVSTRVPGAAILVMASARATLSAGTVHIARRLPYR